MTQEQGLYMCMYIAQSLYIVLLLLIFLNSSHVCTFHADPPSRITCVTDYQVSGEPYLSGIFRYCTVTSLEFFSCVSPSLPVNLFLHVAIFLCMQSIEGRLHAKLVSRVCDTHICVQEGVIRLVSVDGYLSQL